MLDHQLHAPQPDDAGGLGAPVGELAGGWRLPRRGDARATATALEPRELDAVAELVDYLLFVDEAPLGIVKGNAGFAEWFAAQGPKDPAGRSLRDLKLDGRLLRYPLSYLIYARAFDALPAPVKAAVFDRLWAVLSGQDAAPKYAHLTRADRQAIVEILRATKHDLPETFASTAAVR